MGQKSCDIVNVINKLGEKCVQDSGLFRMQQFEKIFFRSDEIRDFTKKILFIIMPSICVSFNNIIRKLGWPH